MNENETHPQQDHDEPEMDTGVAALMAVFLLMIVMLGLLAFWPYTKQYIPGLADPTQVQILGPVERVSFVGGFGTRTQVEVGTSVLLLPGPVEIGRGVLVERRVSVIDDLLCVVGTQHCHEILSR